MIASFLNPMLRLHPDKRAKASELTHHAWLDGIAVQGEIDVIRRAEDDEARRKRGEAAGGGPDAGQGAEAGAGGRADVDVDAMKPVDDVVVGLEADAEGAVAVVPTIAAPVPGVRHAHAGGGGGGEGGGVPKLQTVPPHGKGVARQ
ncbi:hypothetical protein BC628DRAFT_1152954 [Trametes gibbosa]|nr:hypothetical protein BC628DRAFT_1152954 [Trametes gibbosa]